MGSLKRGYLNQEEKNLYMVSKAFIQMLEGTRSLTNKRVEEVWNEWKQRGMLTSSMQKNIKMVHTYLKKFCIELEENLDSSELRKLSKQLNKFDFKIVDDYTLQKLLRDIKDNMKYAVIERDKFENVLEDITAVRCVGCKKDYKECAIHKMLDDISLPYVHEQPNCPYAVDLSELTKEEEEHVKQLKERLRVSNKREKV